jgi:CheY-like chemotaxis protein
MILIAPHRSAEHDLSPKRILIVDRDPKIVGALSRALSDAGLEPVVAEDRASAVDLFQRSRPAAVLLNVDLGGEDGRVVCSAIRGRPEGSIVPILFFGTGDGRQSVHTPSEALAVGADYFFRLPIDFGYLASRVVAWTGTGDEGESAKSGLGGGSGVIGSGSLAAERTAILAQRVEDSATISPHQRLDASSLGLGDHESATDLLAPMDPGAPGRKAEHRIVRVVPSKTLVPWGEPVAPAPAADRTMPGWLGDQPSRLDLDESRAQDLEDARALVRRGEELRAEGTAESAIDAYQAAATLYERSNRGPAIALYKLILHLDPARIDIAKRGAQAALAEDRVQDAYEFYRRCALELETMGELFDASDLLRRMIALDPEEGTARAKLEELERRTMMSSRIDIRPISRPAIAPGKTEVEPLPPAVLPKLDAPDPLEAADEDDTGPARAPIAVDDLIEDADLRDDADRSTGNISGFSADDAAPSDVSSNPRAQLLIVDDSELPESARDEREDDAAGDRVIDADAIDSGAFDAADEGPATPPEPPSKPQFLEVSEPAAAAMLDDDAWARALDDAAHFARGAASSDELIASFDLFGPIPGEPSVPEIAEVASELPLAPDSLELTPGRALAAVDPAGASLKEPAASEPKPAESQPPRPYRMRRPRPKPASPRPPAESASQLWVDDDKTIFAEDTKSERPQARDEEEVALEAPREPARTPIPRASTISDENAEIEAVVRARADGAEQALFGDPSNGAPRDLAIGDASAEAPDPKLAARSDSRSESKRKPLVLRARPRPPTKPPSAQLEDSAKSDSDRPDLRPTLDEPVELEPPPLAEDPQALFEAAKEAEEQPPDQRATIEVRLEPSSELARRARLASSAGERDEPLLDVSAVETLETYVPPMVREQLFGPAGSRPSNVRPGAPRTPSSIPIAPSVTGARTVEAWPPAPSPWSAIDPRPSSRLLPSDFGAGGRSTEELYAFGTSLIHRASPSAPPMLPYAPLAGPPISHLALPDVLPPVPLFPDRGDVAHALDAMLLLGQIRSQRSTGLLAVEDGDTIVFADGQPSALRGEKSARTFADLLIASERISPEAVRNAVQRSQPTSPQALTKALLDRHMLHASEAFVLLDRQLEDSLAVLLSTEARWSFDVAGSDPVLRDELIPQTRDVRDRVLDLIPRIMSFRECVDALGGTRAIIRVSGGFEAIAHAADRRFLLLLDGRARLTEAIDLAAVAPERGAALALVYVMFGLATVFPTRTRDSAVPAAPARSEIPTSIPSEAPATKGADAPRPFASAPALASPLGSASSRPTGTLPPRRPSRAPIEAEAKLKAFAERMRTSDYFAILGVRPDADPEAIREAHRSIRFELRLDELVRSPDLLELAREVRRGLDEARDVLLVPELRAQYQRHLKPKSP